jgi:two-component system, NtrC family, response regulator AtoC
VRILAATNRDLREMATAGRFREDLYFRLSGFHITVPPLRERREDIPALIQYLLARGSERFGVRGRLVIDPDAEEILLAYDWPGNVRELENVLQRATILAEAGRITVADLPPNITPVLPTAGGDAPPRPGTGPLREQVREYEHSLILRAIEECGGDRRAAAQRLGIGLSSLYRKLEESEPGPGQAADSGS